LPFRKCLVAFKAISLRGFRGNFQQINASTNQQFFACISCGAIHIQSLSGLMIRNLSGVLVKNKVFLYLYCTNPNKMENRKEKLLFPLSYLKRSNIFPYSRLPENVFLKIQTNGHEFIIENQAHGVLVLHLNQPMSAQEYDELQTLNHKHFTFETDNYQIIYLRMGTFAVISAITMAIGAGLFLWANQNKSGRVYTEDGEYKFERKNAEGHNEIIRRRPDISYMSYADVSEEKQKAGATSFITHAPTLAIEIVSSAKSLQTELDKMAAIWIKEGTKLGLVICPFTKKIYCFEHGKPHYTEQSIYDDFTHHLLLGYTGHFSQYVDEVITPRPPKGGDEEG
jgi:Uma2 family endonuclease